MQTEVYIIEAQILSLVLFSIIVYKSSQRSKKVRLQHFFTPDKSTVTSLVYKKSCLYVGLVSGSVAIYSRSQGACYTKGGTCEVVCLLLRSQDSAFTNVCLSSQTAIIRAAMSLNHCYCVQQKCIH